MQMTGTHHKADPFALTAQHRKIYPTKMTCCFDSEMCTSLCVSASCVTLARYQLSTGGTTFQMLQTHRTPSARLCIASLTKGETPESHLSHSCAKHKAALWDPSRRDLPLHCISRMQEVQLNSMPNHHMAHALHPQGPPQPGCALLCSRE